jgi:hypothetical protein
MNLFTSIYDYLYNLRHMWICCLRLKLCQALRLSWLRLCLQCHVDQTYVWWSWKLDNYIIFYLNYDIWFHHSLIYITSVLMNIVIEYWIYIVEYLEMSSDFSSATSDLRCTDELVKKFLCPVRISLWCFY